MDKQIHPNADRRLKVLMLVPHEPSRDPRVHYTANALAEQSDVRVLGTVRSNERRPEGNTASQPRYTVMRIPYRILPHHVGMLLEIARLRLFPASRPLGRSTSFALSMLASMMAIPLVPFAAAAFIGAHLGDHLRSKRRSARSTLGVENNLAEPAPLLAKIRADAIYLMLTLSVNGALWDYLRRQKMPVDVVFCHDLYTLQTGVMLKQSAGCKLVYDSHEYYPYQHPHTTFRATTRWYERLLVKYVDLYLTVSQPLADELRAVYSVDSIEVIPNAEPKPQTPVEALSQQMHDIARGRLKVLYQGSFARRRGLEEILAEWRSVDGSKAVLFLRGPPNETLEQLQRLADSYGLLGKCVYILPPVLERDLIAAAAEADVGLIPYKGDLPSYRYACPNKLSQYLHAGLAVVGNDIPFVAGLIAENGVGWVYDVRRLGSFAATIGGALDRVELETRKRNARMTSAGIYNWEIYESRLRQLVRGMTP